MIVKKTWERRARDAKAPGVPTAVYTDTYTGWFLFGFIPLYTVRHRVRL